MDGHPLFSHTDGDDERVEVFQAPNAGHIHIVGTHDGSYLPRSEVLSLIQALTEWAYPTHTPEGPNRSLIEELIAKAVKDQVSAVLPLHLSPVSSVRTRGGRCEGCRSGNHPHVFKACERTGCECLDTVAEHRPQECPGAGQCPEADPEPGDVGHPRPAAAEDGPCAALLQPGERLMGTHDACGMLWVTHRPAYPPPPAAEDGPCAEPGCGHAKDRHRPVCAAIRIGGSPRVCRCNAYKAPLPVREKTVIVPICGLCKQPWNDGHGQPGDPCSTLQATDNVEDRHEALWRVRPSAPASEARYCDECGHSWESHRPEFGQCASIKGKTVCGCTRRPE